MKKVNLIAGIIILFSSCGSGDNKENEVKSTVKDSVVIENKAKDTITFSIESIDEKNYCKQTQEMNFCAKRFERPDENDSLREQKLINGHKQLVKRNGDDLIIKSKTGDLKFTDVANEDTEGDVSYKLWEVNDNFLTLLVYYMEGMEFIVINAETGKSFRTWGVPVFNKNKTRVIAGNSDLYAGFTNNGIQLFEQDKIGWNLKMQKIIDDWGPSNLFWLNDSTILSKKNIVDESDTINGIKTEFVKINLRREKLN